MENNKGLFVSYEGIEGSGKSTQIQLLSKYLESRNFEHILIKEPGETPIGRGIRSLLLDPDLSRVKMTELLLYIADRAENMETNIKPALEANKIVLCDRFIDSTTVYQGYARGIDLLTIYRLNDLVLNDIEPDITFLLSLPVEIGLERARRHFTEGTKDIKESRFEQEKLSFHEKIYQGYLAEYSKNKKRIKLIDASKSIEEVHKEIITHLNLLL